MNCILFYSILFYSILFYSIIDSFWGHFFFFKKQNMKQCANALQVGLLQRDKSTTDRQTVTLLESGEDNFSLSQNVVSVSVYIGIEHFCCEYFSH